MSTAINATRPGAPVVDACLVTDRPGATAVRTGPDAQLDSATLLQGGKAVTIHHNGEFYRLQATRQGKLILTK
jgi:hemin uptake protein HemP